MARRMRRWAARWLLIALLVAVVATGLGPMLVTQLVSGEAMLERATEALGRPVAARSASLTGTAFQPPRLILTEPTVGAPERPLLRASTVEVDLGWTALLGQGAPASVTVVDGLIDLTALPAGDGAGTPTAADAGVVLPSVAFSGDLRLPNGRDLTDVALVGGPGADGALNLSGTATLADRPFEIDLALRDPAPTVAGRGGRIEAEMRAGEDRIALAGGFDAAGDPTPAPVSFRGRVDLSLTDPVAWAELLEAPIPAGLDRLGGLTAAGLVYIAADRIALQDGTWSTPARTGRATLALESVGGVRQIAGSVTVNRFELADLGALVDWETFSPGVGIGTLPVDIDLTAERFGLGPIEVAEAGLSLAVDPPGTVSIGSDELTVFDGTMRLQLSARLSDDVPRLAGSVQMAGIPSVPVATALGIDGLPADGTVDASITLNGRGGDWTAIAESLAGDGFLRLRNGSMTVEGAPNGRLAFDLAGGGFGIERGRIALREFRIEGPTAALTGPVTVALPAGTLAGRVAGGLAGENRTLAVGGTVADPDLRLLPTE